MSDRAEGSVRTAQETAPGEQPPRPATESRAVPDAPRSPATGAGVSTTKAPAGRAAGSQAPASAAPAPEKPSAQGPASSPSTAQGPASPRPATQDSTSPPSAVQGPAGQGTAGQGTAGQGAAGQAAARGVAPAPQPKGGRGPRRARLQLRHIDTWSALKISLVLSIALFFIWMVAIGILYGVLGGLGVFETLNDLFGQLGTATGAQDTGEVITPGIVFGGAAVIGAINIVLMTALCTVAVFIYNLCADLVGGLEVTLSERD